MLTSMQSISSACLINRCGLLPKLHIFQRLKASRRTIRQLFVRKAKKLDKKLEKMCPGQFAARAFSPELPETDLRVRGQEGRSVHFEASNAPPLTRSDPSLPFANKDIPAPSNSQRPSLMELLSRSSVHVQVKRANGLVASHMMGLSDPYCIATAGDATHQTRVVRQSLNPLWGETFVFSGHHLMRLDPIVEFELWSEQVDFLPDHFLGQAELDLRRIHTSLTDPLSELNEKGVAPRSVSPLSCSMSLYVLKASGAKEKGSFGELECDVWLVHDKMEARRDHSDLKWLLKKPLIPQERQWRRAQPLSAAM